MFAFTEWPRIYDIDDPQDMLMPWDSLVTYFTRHTEVTRKDAARGFGPYFLKTPLNGCRRHQDARERLTPHRCDSCVDRLTMAVFDADTGIPDETEELLEKAGLARIWYTTFSHTPAKPSYRLILPFAEALIPELWPEARLALIRKFRIPADPKKCSGKSHFYYLPSCPPGATPKATAKAGEFLSTQNLLRPDHRPTVSFVSPEERAAFAWEPPQHTGDPVDVGELREKLQRRAKALARKGENAKATLIRNMLKGQPLAEKGARNSSTFQLAGMLAWNLPGLPCSVYSYLMRESVDAMISAGSSLTHEDVERMLLTAMRNKAEADYLAQKTSENLERHLREFKESIYRAAGLRGGNDGKASGGAS